MELQNAQKNLNCEVCLLRSNEIKIIFKSLYIHLKKLIRKTERQVLYQQSKKFHFQRLIKILIPEHIQFQINECKHEALIQYFRQKLQIDKDQFQSLCQKVADKIGRRNYQLQTLANQIKNMEANLQKQYENSKIQIKRSEKKKCSIIPIQKDLNQNKQETDKKEIQQDQKPYDKDQKPFISDRTLYSKSELQQNISQSLQKKENPSQNQISPQIYQNNQWNYLKTFPYSGYSFDPNFNPFWSYK